ncbi:hypothetical protein QTQ03_06145 [Micromonospora sp. WMMA1363]|uniref:hypothetical protein n=1 Tax=Micromonospora sp. WMMA1363 TaxID=3053985 RepID=UPI00259D0DCF|nr:hypothetical protein [Micromonospora sp. WMMA1363]MDM4719198.1 hypothetical protein [Micromonospora sp. WMMA1363]
MTTIPPHPPHRSSLGRAYVDQLAQQAPPGDPTAGVLEKAGLAPFRDRFLAGPAFLAEPERDTVARDLRIVYDLLRSLPDRLHDGDLTTLAGAVGMDARQCALITRSARTGSLLPLGRGDLYHDGTGFKLLEFNITSALGGFWNADLNRAMLAHPPLRSFVREHALDYHDTLASIVRTIRAECAEVIPTDRPPVVAVVDTEENFAAVGDRFVVFAAMLADHGVEGVACHLGEFTYPNGQPTVDGRAVDVVVRYFLVEDLSDATSAALLEPLLTAVEQGRVGLFSRLDAELYGNKGTLAMLSDDRHRDRFDAAELACIDRVLPWTRYVRPLATAPDGSRTDLLGYAHAHQHELVLKPTLLHGGHGVVPGWTVDPAEWDKHVSSAMDGPYVLQQRVRPTADPFPDGTGGVQDLVVNWGVFLDKDGYAGAFVRASTDPEVGVVSFGAGARTGCVFHGGWAQGSAAGRAAPQRTRRR